jgi:hypothetical protein
MISVLVLVSSCGVTTAARFSSQLTAREVSFKTTV